VRKQKRRVAGASILNIEPQAAVCSRTVFFWKVP